MRYDWAGRSVICVSAMPAVALDPDELEQVLGRGRPTSQAVSPAAVVIDYSDVRLLVVDGRLQLDLAVGISDEESTRVAGWTLDLVAPYRATGIGFNAALRIETEDGDQDPTGSVVSVDTAASRLGASSARAGLKLIYRDESARVTLSVDPDVDDERTWIASVNRHFDTLPREAEREQALASFAASSHTFESQLRELLARSDHEQHAA